MRKYVKIVLEYSLKHLNDDFSNRTSIFFTKLKNRFRNKDYKGFHRFCDFVVVRCNGNRFIEFELSNICNARCIFCPYPDMLKSGKKFQYMTSETLDAVQLKMNHFKNVLVSFTPTTGDTLLHPNWNDAILKIMEMEAVSRSTFFTNAIALDDEAQNDLIELFASDKAGKLSQIYFSIGGLNADNYKILYEVNRFDLVRDNINALLLKLKSQNIHRGVHIHVKLLKGEAWSESEAQRLFNECGYPYVYFSKSTHYFSNEGFKRNSLIDYYPEPAEQKRKACAYLNKTRFAADGSVWADGCVISELPNNSDLKLGNVNTLWEEIEANRKTLIDNWNKEGILPAPCRDCSMYRA
jgi:wyosine [tRNA(Phe)-imidazoG37] synthetase (radical SAM superfamily)